jgi:hypothetical protein
MEQMDAKVYGSETADDLSIVECQRRNWSQHTG